MNTIDKTEWEFKLLILVWESTIWLPKTIQSFTHLKIKRLRSKYKWNVLPTRCHNKEIILYLFSAWGISAFLDNVHKIQIPASSFTSSSSLFISKIVWFVRISLSLDLELIQNKDKCFSKSLIIPMKILFQIS